MAKKPASPKADALRAMRERNFVGTVRKARKAKPKRERR